MKPTHWAAKDITYLIEQHILDVEAGGFVRPNDVATRGETIEMIARALQTPLQSKFQLLASDVKPNERFYKELCKLTELGVIANQLKFYPNEPLKRGQVAKILATAFQIENVDIHESSFRDVSERHWAKSYIFTLTDLQIINGKTSQYFAPNEPVTRAQLATMIVKMLEFKKAEDNNRVIYDYLRKQYIRTFNEYPTWELEVITHINNIRKENNLPALQRDPALTQLAIIKAQDMIANNYFEHFSSYYGNPWDLAFVFDYQFLTFGENIARNFSTPKDTIDAWMASPGHRANILKPTYKFIGVGVKKNKAGKLYIVNHFSSK